ncbi:hypothetical protein OQA88_5944 [Cercophora sp. LCS_1]
MRLSHSLITLLGTLATCQSQPSPPSSMTILPSFTLPPSSSRPKFRYWFPDASVPPAAVASDIAELSAVSAGGLQFLGFYNQGFPPVSTDWSRYGFGTAAFKELLRVALKEAERYGLRVDIPLGPNTAAGVPAVPRTEGLAMELVMGSMSVNSTQTVRSVPQPKLDFNKGYLGGWVHEPENWGASELVSAVAGRVVRRNGKVVTLDGKSLVDVREAVSNGTGWRPSGQGEWVVFGVWERYSNERSCVSSARVEQGNWVGNGSWMVDHFSAAGAKKMTGFWDEELLDDEEVDGLLRKVGGYSWEDSMEMMAALWWTKGFVEKFKKNRGYDPRSYLPAFFQAKNLWNGYGEPYDTSYTIDGEPADGGKYAEDYRLTLSEGYRDYLRAHEEWANKRGMAHSTQPAYNMPLDMSASIPVVGAPELESLGFGESIENYRQFTGPAHLFGRNIISTEIGAQRGGAYAQPIPRLLGLFQDSFAAGVNTLVIHGMAYGGAYTGTTWPGYTPFQYEFCEMWGLRQPSWRHMNDTLLFASRVSEVLKTGVPKVDLAFLAWKHPWSARAVFPGGDLNAAGYTYEYLGPDNLASPEVEVKDGILAPDGPAYKALVIYGQTRISPSASAALLRFATAGLPIFIVGTVPNNTIGSVGQEAVAENMSRLTGGGFGHVKVLSTDRFNALVLRDADIFPKLSAESIDGAPNASQLYSVWRADQKTGLHLVYLLNRGAASTFSLSFTVDSDLIPYRLDPWTGEQSPVPRYLPTGDGVSMRLTLAKGQATIIGFKKTSEDRPPTYVVSHSSNLARIFYDNSGSLFAYVDDTSEASALLSTNAEAIVPEVSTSLPAPISLGPWNLSVESYSAPNTLPTSSVSPNRTVITVPAPLATLTPWTKIRGLERSSGVGIYRATVTLPAAPQGLELGYTIHLTGQVYNTVRIRVNGHVVPAIDPAAPGEGRDVSSFLKQGQNEVVVEVTSTLFNAVKARMNDVKSIGKGIHVPKYYSEVNWADFGLVGEVVVKSWRKFKLA